jgi:hypothetical protein
MYWDPTTPAHSTHADIDRLEETGEPLDNESKVNMAVAQHA